MQRTRAGQHLYVATAQPLQRNSRGLRQSRLGPTMINRGYCMGRSNWPTTSRHARGYGAAWDKLRQFVLARDGHLCQCRHCKAEGRIKLATHVDHVVSKAKAKALGWSDAQIDDPGNLQAINADCHERKGIEEYGGKPRPKVKIGLDGFPIWCADGGGAEN